MSREPGEEALISVRLKHSEIIAFDHMTLHYLNALRLDPQAGPEQRYLIEQLTSMQTRILQALLAKQG
jgi:hypothetical protein